MIFAAVEDLDGCCGKEAFWEDETQSLNEHEVNRLL
jgi:hypothetical protein